ncbi:hypothetical protein ACFQ48_01310 [Hymenobacter caeli]|uniref:Lipoprotein n=1 Tax=Hymenobacter caeli TaxID=2735894 RepID=A0ABX2FK09_9BACT|nr:hypothetical protein [Hymenobacter caeli]NRT17458.1 hypothetical protein [Hymenobacter caeli]
MMRLLRFLLPLGVIGLLAGCCANNVCDCQDERADAFYFKFVKVADNSANGFNEKTELDTVQFRRYALPLDAKGQPLSAPKATSHYTNFRDYADSIDVANGYDLVTFIRSPATRTNAVQTDSLLLNNNLPFTQQGSRKLNTYLYRIEVRRGPGQLLRNDPRRYELTTIRLVGEFDGTGCCTCYRNTSKTAVLTQLLPMPVPGTPSAAGVATTITATEPAPNSPVYQSITK